MDEGIAKRKTKYHIEMNIQGITGLEGIGMEMEGLEREGKQGLYKSGTSRGVQREPCYRSSRARGYITRSGDKRDILEIRVDKKGYARM